MKKLINLVLSGILAFGLPAAPARAQFIPQATAIPGSAPEGINYQGRLEDGGFPVNATKSMVFRVHSALTGGTLLWTSPAQNVSVALGLFNTVVPVPTTVLVGGGARYLEVQIDGTLMSPRELLNSVPYALIAKSVEGTIDVSTAGLAINANSAAPQPALFISSTTGNVGVGTGSPVTAFDVGGSAQFGSGTTKSTFTAAGALNTAGKITAPDYTATYGISASTAVFTYVQASSITTTGNVNVLGSAGIGTTTPAATLHVVGNNILASASPTNVVIYRDTTAADSGRTISSLFQFTNAASALRNVANFGAVTTAEGVGRAFIGTTPTPMGAIIERLVVDNNGNVGIGTSTPTSNFHVKGAAALQSTTARFESGYAGALDAVAESAYSGPGDAVGFVVGKHVASSPSAPNTAYIWNYENGPLDFATNNLQRMKINGNGNVGIGTTSPASKLHMSSGTVIIDGNAATALTTVGNVGIGTTSPSHALHVLGGSDAQAVFEGTVNAGAEIRAQAAAGGVAYLDFATGSTGSSGSGTPDFISRIIAGNGLLQLQGGSSNLGIAISTATGNVGIGAANPGAKLDVAGHMLFSVAGASITFNAGGPTIGVPIGNTLAFGTSGLERMRLDNLGNVGVGTANPASKLHMSSGTIIVDGNSATALTTVGNAGIGTGGSTPADRLEVAGGNVRLTAVAGSAGSVKLFSALTSGAVTCTAQCGANTFCLAAWDSTGTASTCATALANNRCLCSGFGN